MADRPLEGYSKQCKFYDDDTAAAVNPGDATNRAVRTVLATGLRQRQPDGSYADAPSDFQESLLQQHRAIIYLLEQLVAGQVALRMAIMSLHGEGDEEYLTASNVQYELNNPGSSMTSELMDLEQ